MAVFPDSASPVCPAVNYKQSCGPICPSCPSSAQGSGAELELKERSGVSFQGLSKTSFPMRLISVWLARLLSVQLRVPRLPKWAAPGACDLGVGSCWRFLEAAGLGMGREGKCSHLLSTLGSPTLGCGDLEIVLVSICMCQCDSQCVSRCCCPGSPCTFNQWVGRWGWGSQDEVGWGGAGISLVPSFLSEGESSGSQLAMDGQA